MTHGYYNRLNPVGSLTGPFAGPMEASQHADDALQDAKDACIIRWPDREKIAAQLGLKPDFSGNLNR